MQIKEGTVSNEKKFKKIVHYQKKKLLSVCLGQLLEPHKIGSPDNIIENP